jgi:hypothetical protein
MMSVRAPAQADTDEVRAWNLLSLVSGENGPYTKRLKDLIDARVAHDASRDAAKAAAEALQARKAELDEQDRLRREESEKHASDLVTSAMGMVQNARDEAAKIVAEGHVQVRLLIADAQSRAAKLISEAEGIAHSAEREKAQTAAAYQAVVARERAAEQAMADADQAKAEAQAMKAEFLDKLSKANALMAG